MMKKSLLVISAFALLLTGCGEPSEPPAKTIPLENLVSLLSSDLYVKEVNESNKVEFSEVEDSAGNIISLDETMNIYNDETSFATATLKSSYEDGTEYNNSYVRLVQTKTYNGQKVIYLVQDYENDDLLTGIWYDSAYRLPVVEDGDPSGDGVSYLLQSSVPGQISKQSTLLIAQFIQANLTGNVNLQGVSINAKVEENETQTIYSLDEFTYSFDDEDYLNEIAISFEIVVEDEKMINATTIYKATLSRGEDDVYVNTLTSTYDISYGSRVASSTNSEIINPEDYFLAEVNEVSAFIYGDNGKEYVALNNLPLGEYIHFEASDYLPEKAIDLELYPVSTTNNDVIAIDGNVFVTTGQGHASVVVESQTGVSKTIEVGVNIPPVQGISYSDMGSAIQNDDGVRTIYEGYTYDSIYVFVRPSSASIEDLAYEISDPSVLEISVADQNDGYVEYSFKVLDVNESKEVSVTFYSLSNEEVKETITYKLAIPLTSSELTDLLHRSTYRWDNFMGDGAYAYLTAEGNVITIEYYNEDGSHYCTTTFNFVINGMDITVSNCTSTASEEPTMIFDDGTITLDGTHIQLTYNVTSRLQNFYLVEE